MSSNDPYLFETYNALEKAGVVAEKLSSNTNKYEKLFQTITRNIRHTLRPYQESAIKRFMHYQEAYTQKNETQHMLFEMATGTGKTLVMASLMLYLYEKGYRTFLFFVNSTNIVEKTKQNFTAHGTSKYLFTDNIEIDSELVEIKAIDSIEDANDHCLNILFTTIQGLHSQMQNTRENSVTLQDFTEHKVVLLADEAHHNNTNTKTEIELCASWEDSIVDIFRQNKENHLLEFTATAELHNPAIQEKYIDKAIVQYGLKEFRKDGYSKNIFLAHTKTDEIKERFLLAIILSQYRLEIASKYGLNVKPVILFKSKTIQESNENHETFNAIIESIAEKEIKELFFILQKYKDIAIYKNIYDFFITDDFSHAYIAGRLKNSFSKEKIINANSDNDIKHMQVTLNTLEDTNNKYRVIFAVNKLNEGWDVLNLYDIVKLYETPSVAKKPPTAQEIQLIGRGARLYPYQLDEVQELYKRKYDSNVEHELVVLEQLHFHTSDGSKYIQQLNEDLEKAGLIDPSLQEVEIKLKDEFRASDIYKNGKVYLNEKIKREKTNIFQIDLFGGISIDERFKEIIGQYKVKLDLDNVELYENIKVKDFEYTKELRLQLKDIPDNVFLKAIAKNNYFTFDKIATLLNIQSIRDIKEKFSRNTLTILYPKKYQKKDIKMPYNFMKVCSDFLHNLASFIHDVFTEYAGTKTLVSKPLKDIFKNKKMIISNNASPLDGSEFPYFAQENFMGTGYEKELINDICNFFEHTFEHSNVNPAWLIRNERHFQIYNFDDGKAFEPDFLLMVHNNEKELYQIFVEPKGEHLHKYDAWKETLMEQFTKLTIDDIRYSIITLPFYTPKSKHEFLDALDNKLRKKTVMHNT